jgi:hypothetical protein
MMRRRTQRKHGLSHRLWWLAALTAVAVGIGIVLDVPETDASAAREAAPAHATHHARTPRGG